MSSLIGNIVFDLVDRPFELPKWSTAIFVQPGTQHTGVQMLPPTGRPFTRILTLIDAAYFLQANQDIQTSKVGFALPVTAFGVNYSLTYRRLFFVAHVDILQAEILPHASGQNSASPTPTPPPPASPPPGPSSPSQGNRRGRRGTKGSGFRKEHP